MPRQIFMLRCGYEKFENRVTSFRKFRVVGVKAKSPATNLILSELGVPRNILERKSNSATKSFFSLKASANSTTKFLKRKKANTILRNQILSLKAQAQIPLTTIGKSRAQLPIDCL